MWENRFQKTNPERARFYGKYTNGFNINPMYY